MAHKIHVLLVEHDSNDHDKIMNMLQYFSYEVTAVNLSSTAISILSKRKVRFDLVMANMNSPDSYALELLEDALKMNLLVILISNDDDVVTTMRVLEQGAILCIKKPITMQIMEYLWQHVIRETTDTLKQKEQSGEIVENINTLQKEFREEYFMERNRNAERKHKYSKKRAKSGTQNDNVTFKKKVWAEWTKELHGKFMDAVTQLGEGRCYPKEILELMNVPGLTRMQVASHLQRCRNANMLPPNKKKSIIANMEMTPPKNKAPRAKTVSFGSMPHIDNNNNSQFHRRLTIQEYSEINNQDFTVDDPPIIETNVLGDNHDNGYHHPDQLLLDYGNYSFAHQDSEVYNMEQLGETFGMNNNEPCFMYGDQTSNTTPTTHISSNQTDITEEFAFDFANMDAMLQTFSALQHELGLDTNNGSFQSLVLDQVNHNQIPTVTNAANQ